MRFWVFCFTVFVMSLVASDSSPCFAQQKELAGFRINTDIYEDTKKPPIKRSLTFFQNGVFYDVDDIDGNNVTVIDPVRERIILLDLNRKVQTRLSMPDLERRLQLAMQQMDPKLYNMLASVTINSTNDQLVSVGNENIKYVCRPIRAPDREIAEQFASFADWSARLNAIYPPCRPPFMRLQLNQAVLEQESIPEEVERTTRLNGRESRIVSRSMPNWRLSLDDQKYIARIGDKLVEFRTVEFEEYIKP